MKKLLIAIILFVTSLNAYSQNTVTLPDSTQPSTISVRTKGLDSLHQTWLRFPGIGYNQFYSATEANQRFAPISGIADSSVYTTLNRYRYGADTLRNKTLFSPQVDFLNFTSGNIILAPTPTGQNVTFGKLGTANYWGVKTPNGRVTVFNSTGLTGNRTFDYPDASGVIVLNDNTVALTNKTFPTAPTSNDMPLRWQDLPLSQLNDTWNKRVPMNASDYFLWFGNSFVAGTTSPPENSFAYTLAGMYRKLIANYGLGGSGAFQAVSRAHRFVTLNNPYPIGVEIGFNDERFTVSKPKTKAKMKSATESIVASAFLEVAHAGDTSLITKSGTWTNFADSTYSGRGWQFGSAIQSTGATDYVEFTTNRDNIVVQVINSDGVTLNTDSVNIYVDGEFLQGYNTANKTDGQTVGGHADTAISGIIYLPNLGGSDVNRTIRIQKTSTKPFYLSYIGILRKPSECSPIVFGEVPYMNPAGYASVGGSIEYSDNASEGIKEGLAQFNGYPVTYAYTNQFYTLNNVSGDLVHPTYQGYRQIASAYSDRFVGNGQDGLEQILARNPVSVLDMQVRDAKFYRGDGTGVARFGDDSHFLYWSGTQWILANGKLNVDDLLVINTPTSTTSQYDVLARDQLSGDIKIVPTLNARTTTISSAGTLTLVAGRDYSFSGTTATWTLPAPSAGNAGGTYQITIKNRGSGALTINPNSGTEIYTTSNVSSVIMLAGSGLTFMSDGTYWNVIAEF